MNTKNNNIKAIIKVSKYLFNNNLVSGKAGNVSARFKDSNMDIIAITPTMKSLGSIKEEDIVLVDMDGNNLTKGIPSSEINLHLAIYKEKKDIGAIVHTHSPYATGFAFSTKKIKRMEGFGKIKSDYFAEITYEKPGSDELAKNASIAIKNEDVLILKNHGIIATGVNLAEASALSEFVEEIAKTQFVSYILDKI
jgi:L-fuculose-phosphate aldolase